MVRSVKKFLISTAPASTVRPVIGHNVVLATRKLQSRTNKALALADSPESANVSLNEDYIFLVERPQNCQCKASFVNATQLSAKLIPTTPRKSTPGRRNRSVASSLSKAGFFDDAQRETLVVGCTAEDPFNDGFSRKLVRSERKLIRFSVSRVVNNH